MGLKKTAESSYRECVARTLREARQARGLSQVALASLAGCSVGTVAIAERGGFLTPPMAKRLAAVLEAELQS